MVQITVGTGIVLGLFALLLIFMWEQDRAEAAAGARRRRASPRSRRPQRSSSRRSSVEAASREEEAEKSKEKEGQTKRAKEKAGSIGRNDATPKDTVIPKGEKDILREKVAEGRHPQHASAARSAPGSGLSKLFAQSNDVEQAMAGMAGAKMVVGHGAGGLSTSGSGPGGGGTGYGHIYGAGNLDTGGRGTHGHGRGPKLAERGEHEVVGRPGHRRRRRPTARCRKEQIDKVVRAHLAGVKYCYEKELQHKASLARRRRHLLGDPARRHRQQGERQDERR